MCIKIVKYNGGVHFYDLLTLGLKGFFFFLVR